ncbi:MAG: hypothetical protein LBE03_01915 [Candidatus Nomurabacteria bacterium]|jgi:hypothetical protein|nr:hypothetical protein [Candidatus Nomurabacteria bacterium]
MKKLYCFSPLAMLITFVIEFAGATYALIRYKMNRVGQMVVALLGFLGLFQVAEYMICEKIGGVEWSRIGFFATTVLPPLGLTLGLSITEVKNRFVALLKPLMWVACGLFSFYVLFWQNAITSEVCSGNYVIFHTSEIMWLYSVYYFLLLGTGLLGGIYLIKVTKDKRKKKSLLALVLGTLAFLVPTVIVNLISHETVAAIPSIMCGFAVILALVLIFIILPTSGLKRTYKNGS